MATLNNADNFTLAVGDAATQSPYLQWKNQLSLLRGAILASTIVVTGSDPIVGQLWPIGTRQTV